MIKEIFLTLFFFRLFLLLLFKFFLANPTAIVAYRCSFHASILWPYAQAAFLASSLSSKASSNIISSLSRSSLILFHSSFLIGFVRATSIILLASLLTTSPLSSYNPLADQEFNEKLLITYKSVSKSSHSLSQSLDLRSKSRLYISDLTT